jgi:polyisoprenoid-binding protein YceI
VATWIFEPGHTAAEFRARHMMVTWVRGHFKDIHGRLELDWDHCLDATFEGVIDAGAVWSAIRGVTRAVPRRRCRLSR